MLRRYRPHQLRVRREDDAALSHLLRACRGRVRGEIFDRVTGLRLPWAEAVSINLERRLGQWWLLLNPDIWTRPQPLPRDGLPPPSEDERDALFERRTKFIRERKASRYNRQMGEIMTAWIDVLTGGQRAEIRTFDLQSGEGIDAVAVLDGSAATSLPLLTRRGSGD